MGERGGDIEGERGREREREGERGREREGERGREIQWFFTVCMLSEHLMGGTLPFLYNMVHLGRDVDYVDEQSGACVVNMLVATLSHNFTIKCCPHHLILFIICLTFVSLFNPR